MDNLTTQLTELSQRQREKGYKNNADLIDIAVQRITDLEANLVEFNGLVIESKGLAGYHQNGDVAYWDEFDFINETPIVAADDFQRRLKAQGIREALHFLDERQKYSSDFLTGRQVLKDYANNLKDKA